MKKRPLPDLLLDLDDDQRADVERQLGIGLEPVAHRDVKPENVLARAHGPAAKRTDGYRSQAERDYADWLSGNAGVASWSFERVTLGLEGRGTRWRADFRVTWRAGAPFHASHPFRVLVEVKGSRKGEPFWRGDSRTRALHGAAAARAELGLDVFVAWCVKGEWHHQILPVRPS